MLCFPQNEAAAWVSADREPDERAIMLVYCQNAFALTRFSFVFQIGIILYGFGNGPCVGYCYDINNRITIPSEFGMSIVMFGLNFGASIVPYLTALAWNDSGHPYWLTLITFLTMVSNVLTNLPLFRGYGFKKLSCTALAPGADSSNRIRAHDEGFSKGGNRLHVRHWTNFDIVWRQRRRVLRTLASVKAAQLRLAQRVHLGACLPLMCVRKGRAFSEKPHQAQLHGVQF